MFQIQRFSGIEKHATSRSGSRIDSSTLTLQSLLKRAEDRKNAKDEVKSIPKKRPNSQETKDSRDNNSNKKKKVVTNIREETTEERDSRKASAKEDKKLRKDLIRGDISTGKILIKKIVDSNEERVVLSKDEKIVHSKSTLPVQKVIKDTEVPPNDDKVVEEELNDDLQALHTEVLKTHVAKTFAEQLQPSKSGRDESKKVLSQKRTDEDEDFIGEDENDTSPSEHPELMTVSESKESWELDSLIAQNLIEDGIDHFFPVQRMVIPQLLRNNARLCVQPRDMCVSAPTGSGKTIAYAVPILQSLRDRSIVRLRALLLLPSRELATQVYGVFCRLSRGTDLCIAVCTGQTPLEDEQRLIMGACHNGSGGGRQGSYNNIDADSLFSNRDMYFKRPSSLGISAIDVLICTPGRLLDHIQYTEGFTLQHLRFLVLDEADRLLGNAYHSWVRTLVQSAHSTESSSVGGLRISSLHQKQHKVVEVIVTDKDTESVFMKPSILTLPFLAIPQQPLQRLLFSATLTDNPRKLAMLGIKNPLIIRATSSDMKILLSDDERKVSNEGTEVEKEVTKSSATVTAAAGGYILPHTLEESITICETARRPLVLLSMLLEAVGVPVQFACTNVSSTKIIGNSVITDICKEKNSMLLVFSSSVETTHRLCRLLQLFNNYYDKNDDLKKKKKNGSNEKYLFGGRVAEMSRLMRSDEREIIMRDAASGAIKVLVSSDHMARGIDLPSIKLVVNYDPPKHAKMYVHRVGRTARANRIGYSVTLLKAGQVGAFRKMRSTIGSSESSAGLLRYKSSTELEGHIGQQYNTALSQLPNIIERENRGELGVGAEI